jgi:HSP20 family molecular chaperone IbpA
MRKALNFSPNGLLNIDLVRIVPKEAKPKRIPKG